jgi:multidrug resistance efflux pump
MVRSEHLLTGRGGRVTAALLVALTVVTSGALARRSLPVDDESDAATGARLSDALVGMVRPSDVSVIATPVALTIAELLATVGDEVEAGAPIARIDHTQTFRELAQLELDVERASQEVSERESGVTLLADAIQRLETGAAEAVAQVALAEREAQQVPVRQVKDSPQRAQVAYEQALLRAQRAEQLADLGLVASQDVEDARFAVRIAADDLAIARQSEEAARRLHVAETAQATARRELSLAAQRRQLAEQQGGLERARLALRQAQLRYQTARIAVSDSYVRSPRRGAVAELPVRGGDQLPAGALVATIATLDPIAVDVDVVPSVVRALRVGEAARVDAPSVGVSGRPGRIRSISPVPGDDGRYSIRVLVPNAGRARLLAGQTAYVDFRTVEERRP